MIFISAQKQQVIFYISIGLLGLSLLTGCDKVRLVGPSRCSGRVEVFHSDTWGTVCDDEWSLANAAVVCREMNCGSVLEAKRAAAFGEGKEEIWLDDVRCSGEETSILKCPHRPIGDNNCGHSEDAGVICSDHLRVVNGSSRCSGRVEIYHDGHWKRACNSDWSREEATVVCRELNCGLPMTMPGAPDFGEAHDLSGVKTTCIGNESTVAECTFLDFKETCNVATVVCSNNKPIRLVNGTDRCSGRVEVYYNGQWGTVCDDKWGMPEAAVVCREMNCGTALNVKYKAYFGRGQDQVLLDDIECVGTEKTLSECPHRGFGEHDCDHHEDAGVVCSESVRLVNGTSRCSGRVEVLNNDKWVKVCNSNWGFENTETVCAELECGKPKDTKEVFDFGDGGLQGYTTRCAHNVSSVSQCRLEEVPGSCRGVALSCAGYPPLRLVNGTNRCSGRVEVMHDGQWGTVCDDDWDIRDAEVVCRAMDCGTAQTAKSSAFFGQGQGDIWLDDVACIGNETSLLHCNHLNLGENNCGHGEDAGVVCSADIRLINGTTQCSGRVEFHHSNQWKTAYNVNWGMHEAAVVCREMNCGDAVKSTGSFGHGGRLQGLAVSCTGRENSLTECTLSQHNVGRNEQAEEAAVECTGNVRLVGGTNRCAGRVEFYKNGQWGTMCGDYWDMSDATVVCKQLNCGRVHKIASTAEYGSGTGNQWPEQFECNGLESTLAQCPQRAVRSSRPCNATAIAAVVCAGSLEVRLMNGRDDCSGRLEVRHGNDWYTVCDAHWNLTKADVVCKQLECGSAFESVGAAHFGQGSGMVVEASNSCFDNETSLQKCSLNGFQSARSCGHDRDAGVLCAAQIRLVNGAGQCSGRVEVFYKGQWGTVCDDEWEIESADVVCKQLGCGHAVSGPGSAHFGRGSGPIWLDNVACSGQESALTHCPHNGFGENNCGHGEDAGVICLGALEKPQITLSPSPEVNWGDKVDITCTVVSEQLGGTFILKKWNGSFKMEKYSEHGAVTFTFPSVEFSQNGSYYCEYQKKLSSQIIYYPQGNVADLTVIVKLETPSISLNSPHAMVIYSPETISVTEGTSFSVTCSTYSRYPGGSFYLTKSNERTGELQSAFGHSVFYVSTFKFLAIELKDSGDYSCVYAVNISSVTFCSSPSRQLQITVVAASSFSVVGGVLGGLLLVALLLGVGYFLWRKRGWGAGTLVQFSSKFGGTIQQDVDDRSNRVFDGRDQSPQMKDHEDSRGQEEDKKVDTDLDNSVERVPEDLAGRVCYELEPLVLTQ